MSLLRLPITLLVIFTLAQCGTTSTETSTKLSKAVSLSAGYYSTCATQYGGKLYCWGNTTTGQGGYSGIDACEVSGIEILCAKRPGTISDMTEGVLGSTIGLSHSCGNVAGSAFCWGSNTSGELGDGTNDISLVPVQVQSFTAGVTSLAAGFSHTCGVMAGGAHCWGDNTLGQLGDSTNNAATSPVPVTGLAAGVTRVSVGAGTSCALLSSGEVQCWGSNLGGQLGDGSVVVSANVPVVAIAANATDVANSVGETPGHSCALVNGGVKCWGLNTYGQLGDGTITNRNTPTDVVGLTSGVSAIAVGGNHSCAIVNGGLKCWGLNSESQLGTGTSDLCIGATEVYSCSRTPVSVSTLNKNISASDRGVISIAAGYLHSCAVLDDLTVACWGDNSAAQLGNNSVEPSLLPTPVLE